MVDLLPAYLVPIDLQRPALFGPRLLQKGDFSATHRKGIKHYAS